MGGVRRLPVQRSRPPLSPTRAKANSRDVVHKGGQGLNTVRPDEVKLVDQLLEGFLLEGGRGDMRLCIPRPANQTRATVSQEAFESTGCLTDERPPHRCAYLLLRRRTSLAMNWS